MPPHEPATHTTALRAPNDGCWLNSATQVGLVYSLASFKGAHWQCKRNSSRPHILRGFHMGPFPGVCGPPRRPRKAALHPQTAPTEGRAQPQGALGARYAPQAAAPRRVFAA